MTPHPMLHKPDIVYDAHLGEDIPFSNPSDAKLARLALSHNVPISVIDIFLAILRDTEFRSDQITFQSGFDIFQHVADYRTKRADARAIRQLQEVAQTKVEDVTLMKSSSPFLQIVLYLVIDELKEQYAIAIREDSSAQHVAKSTLSRMTLVHRSCTLPAQRALGYALRLIHKDSIRRALCSPLFGSWTKRAYFLYGGNGDKSPFYSQIAGETLSCIAVYGRLHALYRLTITFKAVRDDDIPYAEKLLEGISKLPFLRELVVDVRGSYHLLSKSFSVLPELRSLVSFTAITNVEIGYPLSRTLESPSPRPELCPGLTPSHTLTYVRFVAPACEFKEARPFIERLTRPREGFSVQALCIELNSYQRVKSEEFMQLVDAIRPALSNLLSLELHSYFPSDDDEGGGGDTEASMNIISRTIMHACNSLRRIAICNYIGGNGIPRYFYDAFPLAPPTLQEILLCNGRFADFCHGEYQGCRFSQYIPTDSSLDTTPSTN